MAIPRVFISSTCYDLKHIRENLKYFVRTIGYEPVLSDEGDVFYSPSSHTHDSCLKEVSTCQIFVLIIGGRYGGEFKGSSHSITNNEYREAIKNNIPVFALVEQAVHSDHYLYQKNIKENPHFAEKIAYPSCDNIKIFHFIDEVRKQAENNALFPFKDFSDMEQYLKKQWAGMMYDFLDSRLDVANSKVTNKLLDDLSLATRKSEELIKVLLKATSSETADETIQNVSTKVQAEEFLRLIKTKFGFNKFGAKIVNQLNDIELDEHWFNYLSSINGFYLEEFEHDNEMRIVIWGPNSQGIEIGHYAGDGKKFSIDTEMERSYRAFRAISLKDREKLVRDFDEQF
ncbi:MAG: DUF4062 domain-containing protein [Gammaproteobacteria bacterium]|nr:MAG: DUF4062 domain-containing protein [Gammaproteobacteria bacterium]